MCVLARTHGAFYCERATGNSATCLENKNSLDSRLVLNISGSRGTLMWKLCASGLETTCTVCSMKSGRGCSWHDWLLNWNNMSLFGCTVNRYSSCSSVVGVLCVLWHLFCLYCRVWSEEMERGGCHATHCNHLNTKTLQRVFALLLNRSGCCHCYFGCYQTYKDYNFNL